MNEQLIVKNFGPIKDATVDFKRVTVFIGPTGGGKSTLAKLAAIMRNRDFLLETGSGTHISLLQEQFSFYNLTHFTNDTTKIGWESDLTSAEFADETLILLNNDKQLGESRNTFFSRISKKYNIPYTKGDNLKILEQKLVDLLSLDEMRYVLKNVYGRLSWTHYIPAERVFLSAISNALAGLTSEQIALPKTLLQFAADFEVARNEYTRIEISKTKPILFQGALFIFHEEQNKIILPSGKIIPLNEAASGIQSAIPMITLIESTDTDRVNEINSDYKLKSNFIVEEPELNLYPVAQQEILTWLVRKCTKRENDLTITTHSPYILSHLNLLLYAYQVAEKHPDRADEVAELVPRASWINPKEFACYQVENGGVTSLVNEDLGLIDDNGLDNLSGDAADAFDNLIRLSKGVARK